MIERPRERSDSQRRDDTRTTRTKCVLASSMTPPVAEHQGKFHVRCVQNINMASAAVPTKHQRRVSLP